MKISKNRLRKIIQEEILRENPEGEPADDTSAKTTAGKRMTVALDKSGSQYLLDAINLAKSKEEVKEVLRQLNSKLSDKGSKYLQVAMKELVNEV